MLVDIRLLPDFKSLFVCVTRYGLCVCSLQRYTGLQHSVHADLQCCDEEQAAYLSRDSSAELRVGGDVGRRFHWLVHRQRRADAANQLSYHHFSELFHRFCDIDIARRYRGTGAPPGREKIRREGTEFMNAGGPQDEN